METKVIIYVYVYGSKENYILCDHVCVRACVQSHIWLYIHACIFMKSDVKVKFHTF
jgi:hypothetical protein